MKLSITASASLLLAGLAVASCGGGNGRPPTGTAGTTGAAGGGTAGTNPQAGTSGSPAGAAGTTGGAGDTGAAGTMGAAGTTPTMGGAGTTGAAGVGAAGGPADGGAGTGTGMAGTGGGAGTAGAALPTITSTTFGAFDNAFMITPCQGAGSGYDCPNLPQGQTSCPNAAWTYGSKTTSEGIGNTYDEVFTVAGGDPTKIYDVTVHVLGQAEGRLFTGGMRSLAANVDPNAAANDLLYIGGQPGTTRVDYNVYQMTITPPAGGTAIPGAPTYYAFNAIDQNHEGNHYNYGVDSTFTFKVKSGFTVTLTSHDSNCIAIKNCGPGGPYGFANANACAAVARSTPAAVTLPTTFRGTTLTNPMKFQTQFMNFKVTKIVAE